MNEFRLEPETLSFTLISKGRRECRACALKTKESASLPAGRSFVKIYEMKDYVQPSKYELSGEPFKKSEADGYEELAVFSEAHGKTAFGSYGKEMMEDVLSIISDRAKELEKYGFGRNIAASSYLKGHGYFDMVILDIPSNETGKCKECQYVKNAGNREIYSDDHFSVYSAFAPKHEIEISVSPKSHVSMAGSDPVILFGIADITKKLISLLGDDITVSLMESGDGHVKLRICSGEVGPFEALSISHVYTNPEEMSKELRDKLR